MQLEWKIEPKDVQQVLALLERQAENRFVLARKLKNLAAAKPPVDRNRFWFQMVAMRLTSVQRSGPNSAINRFISTAAVPVSYDAVSAPRSSTSRPAMAAGAEFSCSLPQAGVVEGYESGGCYRSAAEKYEEAKLEPKVLRTTTKKGGGRRGGGGRRCEPG